MFKFLQSDFKVKLISLLLAVGLWVYVTSGESRVINFPGEILIQPKGVPESLVALLESDKVKIKVVTEGLTWQKLTSDYFQAFVDLSGKDIGTYEVEVEIFVTRPQIRVVEKNPAKILVHLQPLVIQEVNVVPKIEGKPGEGLIPGSIQIIPASTKVSGPKMIVENLPEVVARVKLAGETESLIRSVKLAALDAQGNEIRNLKFSPPEVKISIPLQKGEKTRQVGVVAKIKGRPKSSYWISSITVTPPLITISGSSLDLEKINSIQTVDIDVEGISENKSFEADLAIPAGVFPQEELKKVKVELTLSANLTEREIGAGYNWQNLSTPLVLTSFSPTSVRVIVSGPIDLLNSLTASNVLINLDLVTYRSPGIYSIDLKKAFISVPGGVEIVSFFPSAIVVKLENR